MWKMERPVMFGVRKRAARPQIWCARTLKAGKAGTCEMPHDHRSRDIPNGATPGALFVHTIFFLVFHHRQDVEVG